MAFWDKVKGDVSKGLNEGVAALKDIAEELTDEGKRKYKVYDLKSRAEKLMSDLGGIVYDLHTAKQESLGNEKVKTIVGKIAKLEAEISKLEAQAPKSTKKKTAKKKAKKKAAKKKTVRKKVAKD